MTDGVAADDVDGKVRRLIEAVQDLKDKVNIPHSIQEAGVDEKAFLDGLDALSEEAFDDQCTGANARYPLIPEIKELFLKAYYGKPLFEDDKPAKGKKK